MSWLRAQPLPALLFAGIPIALLTAIGFYQFLVAEPRAEAARATATASFEALQAIDAVGQAIQDAERGQRGFLLTDGREAYLEPYLAAKARLPGLMADLQRATNHNSDQQTRVLTLQSNLTTKLNELASTLAAFRAGDAQRARGIVQNDSGLNSMQAIQRDLQTLTLAEGELLTARQRAAGEADRRTAIGFVIAGLVAISALLVGAFFIGRTHRQLSISETMLQSTLDSVREGVAAFDNQGRFRAWNAAFAKFLGLAPEAMQQGQTVKAISDESVVTSELIARMAELDATAKRTGRPALVTYRGPQNQWLEMFHHRDAEGYVTTILDVSEQRQTEEALRQSQKLDSIGQMTGSIAHDFNNLLTIIVGALGFLRSALPGNPKALQRVDMLELATERATRLTKQLLAFARRQPLQPETVNLGTTMSEILPLVRRAVGDGIVVESVIDGGLWNTMVDPAQFQSAVLNLAINSRHAISEAGKITIEVGNAALDDIYAARHADVEPGQYVRFAITDTGAGMDAETLARAVDPFFTTRPPGEGTGLGLAQVYGFVKQSGGHMKIYSEVGEGTTVKLYLPRSLQQAVPARAQATNLALTGTEIVLLVDDDDVVRATVSSMLEDLGYKVLVAGAAKDALDLLKANPNTALLFTDVVMPGMGGRALAEEAVKIQSNLRVLFTSGYTQNAIVHNGRLDVGVELLSKPYDRTTLAAKVRRVLDTPSTQTSVGSQR